MNRNVEFLKKYIHILLDEENVDCVSTDCIFTILPKRRLVKNRFGRLVGDIINDLQCKSIFKKALLNENIDISIIHFLTNAVRYRKILQKFQKPVFIHCHGVDVTWELYEINRKWRKIWWGEYKEEVRKLPENVFFIANSISTKKKLIEIKISATRIHVINPGVPIPKKVPVRIKENSRLIILFLGRLIDVKGPDLTIKAFLLACKSGLDAELIIAGEGKLMQTCKILAADSEYSSRIIFLGRVTPEEGNHWRKNADIFTAHSQKGSESLQEEAFGVAFVEAMAAGLPIVTGASGSLNEIVRDGIDGILFKPGDIDSHANSLLQLANNNVMRESMGLSAARRAKERYSIEREKNELFNYLGIAE